LEKKFLPLIKYTLLLLPVFIANLYFLKRIFSSRFKNVPYLFSSIVFLVLLMTDIFLIMFSVKFRLEMLLRISAYFNMFLIILELSLISTLPFIFIFGKIFSFLPKEVGEKENRNILRAENDENIFLKDKAHKDLKSSKGIFRRDFIKKTAFFLPLSSFSIASFGFYSGLKEPEYRFMDFHFKNLPLNFDNLKIVQISDLHLSFFLRLDYLEKIIKKLNEIKPDMVLLTGDFVDDYKLLEDALTLVKGIENNYGLYAVAGNHEYYRGIEYVKKAFKKQSVPLMFNEIKKIKVKNSLLEIVGIDDPGKTGFDPSAFLYSALDEALKKADKDSFKILMSHRPNIFPYASQKGIDLTLSGHTHGGQIAYNGKSIFEFFSENKYWLGDYKINESILYTTSGAGTWFPERFNCPAEIPVITLKRR